MKSERRHNLESNELVTWLEKFRPYAGQATAVVAVLVAVLAIRSIWQGDNSVREAAAWDAFALAHDTNDPELMAVLTAADNSDYQGTSMPEWAHVTWADRQLLLANQAYLVDRSAALARLEKIQGIYDELAGSASDAEVQNRAHFGLARLYELKNDLDEAKKEYAAVQGDLVTVASQRASQLDSPEVQEACAWLHTAELPSRASAGTSGTRPSFDAQIPSAGPAEFDPKTLEDLLSNIISEDKQNDSTEDRYSETTEETTEENTEETAEETTEEKPEAEDTVEDEEDSAPADAPSVTEEPASEEPTSEETATEEPAVEEAEAEAESAVEEPAANTSETEAAADATEGQ